MVVIHARTQSTRPPGPHRTSGSGHLDRTEVQVRDGFARAWLLNNAAWVQSIKADWSAFHAGELKRSRCVPSPSLGVDRRRLASPWFRRQRAYEVRGQE